MTLVPLLMLWRKLNQRNWTMTSFAFSSQTKGLIYTDQLIGDVKIWCQELMVSCLRLDGFLMQILFQIPIQQPEQLAMEYLLVCREQGGSSSPREFYNFLTEFQKASRIS
ncbi:uncharacterized protein LOC112175533 isoform X1 [Rosa chinensis]|uniref:uncharacterized protein LOC112175533 isoform X1 n=1 Tax=Rosa chinensis TaxID=74649 RepID=UPI001AD94AD1|nr:uncharacterized protein LOC112175533 isoform X1 [Rosa chinensis]